MEQKKKLFSKLFGKKEEGVVSDKEEAIPKLADPPQFSDDHDDLQPPGNDLNDNDSTLAKIEEINSKLLSEEKANKKEDELEEPTPPMPPDIPELEDLEVHDAQDPEDGVEILLEEPVATEESADDLVPPSEPDQKEFDSVEEFSDDFNDIVENVLKNPETVKNVDVDKFERQVHSDHEFVLKSGKPLKSLRDLMVELENMDEETFQHHVNDSKNDFANWISGVLEHEKLAEDIRNKEAKHELMDVLKHHEEDIKKEIGKVKIGAVAEELQKKKQELEHEKIKLAGLQNKAENKIKTLEKEKHAFEKEKKGFKEEVSKFKADKKKHGDNVGKHKKHVEELDKKHKNVHGDAHKKVESMKEELEAKTKEFGEKLAKEKRKFEKNLEAEKKKLADDEKKLQDKLKKERDVLKKEKDVLKKDFETKNKGFAKKIADLQKQEASEAEQKKELDVKKKEIGQLEKELAANKKDLEATKKESDDAVTKLNKKIDVERKAAAKYKTEKEALEKELGELKKNLDEKKKVKKSLEKVERHIRSRKSSTIDDVNVTSVEDVEKHLPKASNRSNPEIYSLIEECRVLIEKGNLPDAKKKYYELKEKYESAKMTGSEKSQVYYAIREIYDDIHLAMLN